VIITNYDTRNGPKIIGYYRLSPNTLSSTIEKRMEDEALRIWNAICFGTQFVINTITDSIIEVIIVILPMTLERVHRVQRVQSTKKEEEEEEI